MGVRNCMSQKASAPSAMFVTLLIGPTPYEWNTDMWTMMLLGGGVNALIRPVARLPLTECLRGSLGMKCASGIVPRARCSRRRVTSGRNRYYDNPLNVVYIDL